jgi:Sec-independent protein secretion pathway component TatC
MLIRSRVRTPSFPGGPCFKLGFSMYSHIKELGARFLYCFFIFVCCWLVFIRYSSVWLEFIIINFNRSASGVFFCLGSLITTSFGVSIFLTFFLTTPFCLFQLGLYFIPSLYSDEQINLVFIYFSVIFNFWYSAFIWWLYLLPYIYFVFVHWFSASGLAITYIPEFTSIISIMIFIFVCLVLFMQLPNFLFIGVLLNFWDILFLGKNRISFYFSFILVSTFISPPEIWFQFFLAFFFICGFEFTLFFIRFLFISKVFLGNGVCH